MTTPEAVAQQDDCVATRLCILAREPAAEGRFDAEHWKERRCDLESLDLHRARFHRHVEGDATENRGLLERVHALAPLDVVDRCGRRGRHA